MTFKELIKTDMASVLSETDEVAEAITYTPFGGSGTPINGIIDREPGGVSYGGDGQGTDQEAIVTVIDDATTGVTSPAIKDSVTFDGKIWGVVEVTSNDGTGSHDLRVAYHVSTEKSRENHKNRRRT